MCISKDWCVIFVHNINDGIWKISTNIGPWNSCLKRCKYLIKVHKARVIRPVDKKSFDWIGTLIKILKHYFVKCTKISNVNNQCRINCCLTARVINEKNEIKLFFQIFWFWQIFKIHFNFIAEGLVSALRILVANLSPTSKFSYFWYPTWYFDIILGLCDVEID